MPRRYRAQRKHIVRAFEALLYQLFCFSFYLSPSLFNMLLRLSCQLVSTATREVSPTLSLGHFFGVVLLGNSLSVWNHATKGTTDGRAVILDFVGLAYAPSKFQLLFVDFSIIIFQILLSIISFEMHTPDSSTADTSDFLLPTPTSPIPPLVPSTPFETPSIQKVFGSPNNDPEYIIDIRLSSILARLRNTPTISRSSNSQDSLMPFPNTTSLPIPMSLLMRTTRRRQAEGAAVRNTGQQNRETVAGSRTVPGGMNTDNLD